jgi:hypothetical protein
MDCTTVSASLSSLLFNERQFAPTAAFSRVRFSFFLLMSEAHSGDNIAQLQDRILQCGLSF